MTPRRAKRQPDPIYVRPARVIDPSTGEEIGALIPASASDRQRMREKKYSVGCVLRAELRKPRNPKFHRLVMAALNLVLENQDGLLTIDQLLTVMKIKMGRVQTLIDPVAGKTYFVPESIAFDAMDEGAFQIFWRDMCRVITRDYLPEMDQADIENMAMMMAEAV